MKFCGLIGFYKGTIETSPGIYVPNIEERKYVGDVFRNNRRFQSTEYQNDQLSINNQISILSDLYSKQNWSSIRYVVWNGAKLKVTSIEIDYPRIKLEVGGVYNGEDETRSPS